MVMEHYIRHFVIILLKINVKVVQVVIGIMQIMFASKIQYGIIHGMADLIIGIQHIGRLGVGLQQTIYLIIHIRIIAIDIQDGEAEIGVAEKDLEEAVEEDLEEVEEEEEAVEDDKKKLKDIMLI
jgi:hypothetical protein